MLHYTRNSIQFIIGNQCFTFSNTIAFSIDPKLRCTILITRPVAPENSQPDLSKLGHVSPPAKDKVKVCLPISPLLVC